MDLAMAADDIQVPVIDLTLLQKDSPEKSLAIKQIHEACSSAGIFHVINHGICEVVIQEAMDVNSSFFGLPVVGGKEKLISDDIRKAVRFHPNQGGTQGISREFLKLYACPFEEYVSSWPDNPPDYREKMGKLAMEMRELGIEILGAIMESLNLEATATNVKEKISQGMQMIAVNNYPPILSESDGKKIGIIPHTDHGIITILIQSSPGLEILMDEKTGKYGNVFLNHINKGSGLGSGSGFGSIQILVGDHLEALSNGKYKAVWHRAIQRSRVETRLSIASSHSLGMDEVVEPAVELVDEEPHHHHPKQQYKGSSLRDYLNYLASGGPKPFIETLKLNAWHL